jgi:GNAT superfamily N-acetyltransferase
MEIVPAASASEVAHFCTLPSPGGEDVTAVARHRADAHWMALRDGAVTARCSLWWSSAPPHAGHRTGVIGHFAAQDDAAALLNHACGELARQGCTIAIGPMDGNTWRRYRVLTERGAQPPFFLEPDNPDQWAQHFLVAGFASLAEYYSARANELATDNPRAEAVWNRLSRRGFSIRALDMSRLETELESLYSLALASFARNFLYTPLAKDEFLANYRSIMPYVRPELVLIAEHEAETAGFLFAVPDLLEARRGATVSTFIVKTLAVHPAYSGRGLGSVLLWQANRAARDCGYRSAIHALMHQENESMRISGREGYLFRRYTLFARELAAPA